MGRLPVASDRRRDPRHARGRATLAAPRALISLPTLLFSLSRPLLAFLRLAHHLRTRRRRQLRVAALLRAVSESSRRPHFLFSSLSVSPSFSVAPSPPHQRAPRTRAVDRLQLFVGSFRYQAREFIARLIRDTKSETQLKKDTHKHHQPPPQKKKNAFYICLCSCSSRQCASLSLA